MQVVSGVACLSRPVSCETVWGRVRNFVDTNPKYRCRIAGSRSLFWDPDEHFDFSNHCIELTLRSSSPVDILTHVSNEAARGLDRGSPPWRVAIIRSKCDESQPDHCAIAFWAHHSLIDGLEGMKLYLGLLDSFANSSARTSPGIDSNSPVLKRERFVSGSCARTVAVSGVRRQISCPLSGNQTSNLSNCRSEQPVARRESPKSGVAWNRCGTSNGRMFFLQF